MNLNISSLGIISNVFFVTMSIKRNIFYLISVDHIIGIRHDWNDNVCRDDRFILIFVVLNGILFRLNFWIGKFWRFIAARDAFLNFFRVDRFPKFFRFGFESSQEKIEFEFLLKTIRIVSKIFSNRLDFSGSNRVAEIHNFRCGRKQRQFLFPASWKL